MAESNVLEIILFQGLPGSGKTTAAFELLTKYSHYRRLNRDDLRAELHDNVWSQENEEVIRKVEQERAKDFLNKGYTVIIDDTNLSRAAILLWENFVKEQQVPLKVVSFLNVPIEVCIERDAARPRPVGAQVIKDMYARYQQTHENKKKGEKMHVIQTVTPLVPAPAYNPELPSVVICDLDGTLCLFDREEVARNRGFAYWRDFTQDTSNDAVRFVLASIVTASTTRVIFMSGRSERAREMTEKWLAHHFPHYEALYMRADGDNRTDYLVKLDLYDTHIRGKKNVRIIFDDRTQVVQNCWRALGLDCFQVAPGDF